MLWFCKGEFDATILRSTTRPAILELLCQTKDDLKTTITFYRSTSFLLERNTGKQVEYIFDNVIQIVNSKSGCEVKSVLPQNMFDCHCIEKHVAGCNITVAAESVELQQWKCAYPLANQLEFSNIIQVKNIGEYILCMRMSSITLIYDYIQIIDVYKTIRCSKLIMEHLICV